MRCPLIEDPKNWMRVGRGRELQFFATDEDVQRWLTEALPQQFAPYLLAGVDKIKEGRSYSDRPFQCSAPELLPCIKRDGSPRSLFWLASLGLTPELQPERAVNLSAYYSFNGLILLNHGSLVIDYRDPARRLHRPASRITIGERVRHVETGEERFQEGYALIFQALHQHIRRDLLYSSIHYDKQGNEWEDICGSLWTAAAVRQYEEGVAYQCRPSRLFGNV